jgi:hypothetical protein
MTFNISIQVDACPLSNSPFIWHCQEFLPELDFVHPGTHVNVIREEGTVKIK